MGAEDIERALHQIDDNGDGVISYEEFTTWWVCAAAAAAREGAGQKRGDGWWVVPGTRRVQQWPR